MALKAILNSLDGLPDAVKSEYKPGSNPGTFMLDVEPVNGLALEDVGGLKTALQSERSKNHSLSETVKGLDGLDLAKAREAMAKVDEWMKADPVGKARTEWEARERQITEKHAKEVEAAKAETKRMLGVINDTLVVSEATKAISEHKGVVELLLPHVVRQVRVRQDGEKFVTEVIDEQTGQVRIDPTPGQNGNLTIAGLVKHMKSSPVFSRAFEGSGASGGGGSGSDRPAGGGSGHRITAEQARNPATYRAAKEAAEKAGAQLEITPDPVS